MISRPLIVLNDDKQLISIFSAIKQPKPTSHHTERTKSQGITLWTLIIEGLKFQLQLKPTLMTSMNCGMTSKN